MGKNENGVLTVKRVSRENQITKENLPLFHQHKNLHVVIKSYTKLDSPWGVACEVVGFISSVELHLIFESPASSDMFL